MNAFPPGPRGWDIWAYIRGSNREKLAAWGRARDEFGDLVYAHFLGQHFYLLNHPDHIRAALVEHGASFLQLPLGQQPPRRPPPSAEVDERRHDHRRLRRIIQPAFQPANVAHYGRVMVDYTQSMLASWTSGETRDLSQDMTHLTLRIVGRALFDADVTDSSDAISQVVTVGAKFLTNARTRLPLPTPSNLRLLRAWNEMNDQISSLISQRRQAPEGHDDLLTAILQATDLVDGSGLSDKEAHDTLISLFIAGHETTAVALGWAAYLLAQHPQAEAALWAELDTVLQGRPPTVDDLPQLPYTDAVIRETLRLYPPAWVLFRYALEGAALGGHDLPPGSYVLMSPYVMQRDARWYPEPEQFRPERWLDGSEADLPRYAYYPFGGGAHVCTGQFFAWQELQLVLATIAQCWQLRLTTPVAIEPVITLRPDQPIQMVVEPR